MQNSAHAPKESKDLSASLAETAARNEDARVGGQGSVSVSAFRGELCAKKTIPNLSEGNAQLGQNLQR